MVNVATEMQRQGFDDPAADRRRHDLARAHRGQGRRQVRRPGRLGQGRLPLGAGRSPRCSATPSARSCWPTSRPTTTRCASGTRPSTTGRCSTLEQARANRTPIDWDGYAAAGAAAARARTCSTDYDLAELRDYIDWQPFFNAWEMKGKFPDILNNPTTGEAARTLYDDAQEMLDRIIDEKWLTANARLRASSRRTPSATTSRSTPTTSRAERPDDAAPPAPAGRAPRRACRTGRSATSSRRARPGSPTTSARSRSPPASGSQERIQAFKDAARRLLRDPAGVARRPARRGVRRAAAPAGAHRVLGPRRRRAAATTRT